MRIIVLLALLICTQSNAQLVVNNSNFNLHSETYFNPKFLKVNQIEKITGKISIKIELWKLIRYVIHAHTGKVSNKIEL